MAKSTIDLDELKKFQMILERVSAEMNQERKQLSESIINARHYWSDHHYEVFAAKWSHFTYSLMSSFDYRVKQYIEWMDRKVAAGRKYLGR